MTVAAAHNLMVIAIYRKFFEAILVFKDAERISDSMALTSLPPLLEGHAPSRRQGAKYDVIFPNKNTFFFI